MLLTILVSIDTTPMQLVSPLLIEISTYFQIQFAPVTQGLVLAQQFQNTDLLGNIQSGWTDFLQTGKAGTLAIGLVLGYMIRGITR